MRAGGDWHCTDEDDIPILPAPKWTAFFLRPPTAIVKNKLIYVVFESKKQKKAARDVLLAEVSKKVLG